MCEQLTAEQVKANTIKTLGFDPEYNKLTLQSVLAASLRRAAGLLCPCPRQDLIRSVIKPLEHADTTNTFSVYNEVIDADGLKKLAEETLKDLITYGDVFEDLELPDASGLNRPLRQIYRTSPCFFKRPSGSILVIGIPPDGVSPLPEEIKKQIKPVRCLRILENKTEEENLTQKLENFWGLPLPEKQWLKKPPKNFIAHQLLDSVNEELDNLGPSGAVEGLSILDPTYPVSYYNGRWTTPKPKHSGRYIGKRPQRYGSSIFCFIEILKGQPVKLIDFPLNKIFGSVGYDQAWWVQMAIDYERGKPQFVEIKNTPEGVGPANSKVIAFFSPIPSWAQRRLEVFGEKNDRKGCLFSYILPDEELDTELKFIKEFLWLEVKEKRPGSSLGEMGERIDAALRRLKED